MLVRRSAANRPMPLQKVLSVTRSPKRGKASTRNRIRRTTQAPPSSKPASMMSA